MKRVVIIALAVAALSTSDVCVVGAQAADICAVENEESGIVTYVNDIVYKYRVYQGKLQYRRWNNTKKCWVDSHWINA